MTIDTDLATRPEILACWERANAVMPPSDPANPDDPSVSLDTLAAIAHAKWAALDRVETELARLRQENARLERGRQDFHNTVAALERELARLQEGLRQLLDCKGSYNGTVTERGGEPAVCTKCEAMARALLAEDGAA